ncbi:LacI family DNA-binding transcriptional regulator [Microbacterium sp. ASV49]|uniref:LacI family DNA-binding transcriptional regulator n=1 Tax=Microbacterium candidum TaxID=3041922 RepID=A0ABT7MXV2_9MICO|nr:LacI family DNA-binding transcriptional regulator [Microbacterium sp. ASV49]MDL9979262.1 LacI family DNA-binding transcriptional regulator [Microbacterium sp. ASV49]
MDRAVGRREVTIRDVAAAAQVSKATAARALGDYGAVRGEVRERVRRAAAQLGYRPNAVARTMSTGRSQTIGMVVGDIQNPFFAQAARGASDAADAAGYELILSNSDEAGATETKAIGVQLDKRVDGLLIAPASSSRADALRAVTDAGRPLVLFDRTVPGLEADAVVADNRRGAIELTRLLTDAGHRRIAFLSTIEHPGGYRRGDIISISSVADRVAGFEHAMRDAGADAVVRLGAPRDDVEQVAVELLTGEGAVTAVVASDSLIALDVYRACRDLGLRIPRDVSLVAFDDADWAGLVEPGITVMSQPMHAIGAEAAGILLSRIGGAGGRARVRVFDQELILRGSVAPPPEPSGRP